MDQQKTNIVYKHVSFINTFIYLLVFVMWSGTFFMAVRAWQLGEKGVGEKVFITGFMMLLFGRALFVYLFRIVRSVDVEGQSFIVCYPKEEVREQIGSVKELTAHKVGRHMRGSRRGVVRFLDASGQRRRIKIRLDQKGGSELFNYFQEETEKRKTL